MLASVSAFSETHNLRWDFSEANTILLLRPARKSSAQTNSTAFTTLRRTSLTTYTYTQGSHLNRYYYAYERTTKYKAPHTSHFPVLFSSSFREMWPPQLITQAADLLGGSSPVACAPLLLEGPSLLLSSLLAPAAPTAASSFLVSSSAASVAQLAFNFAR